MTGLLTPGKGAPYFPRCLVHREVVADRRDQQPSLHVNAAQTRPNTCPPRPGALLPLTITRDRGADIHAAGTPDPRAAAHFAPHPFNAALPCNFPCIVICQHFHSHTCIMSPVASISCLSHLLIALKLQFTWIAFDGPDKTPFCSDGMAADWRGPEAVPESPVETSVTSRRPVVGIRASRVSQMPLHVGQQNVPKVLNFLFAGIILPGSECHP